MVLDRLSKREVFVGGTTKNIVAAIFLVFALNISFGSVSVFADSTKTIEQNPMVLLSDMSHALRNLSYEGRFVYLVGGEISSFYVSHANIDNVEHERLRFLNKSKEEVVRVGHEVYCVHPGNHLLRHKEKVSSNPIAEKFSKLSGEIYKNYDIEVHEGGRVAELETIQVVFRAKDKNRYDHSLWLEKNSKLLLKISVGDSALGNLETFEYVQMNIGIKTTKDSFDHSGYLLHKASHPGSHGDTAKQARWLVNWLPSGFHLTGIDKQELPNGGMVEVLMYTDGLAAITVIVDQVDKVSRFGESSQSGALSAYSQSYSKTLPQRSDGVIEKEHFMVTVVGDITLNAAEKVARSISPI